jgi:CubicO group peptidase (beta-lactamase class C family)
MALHFIAKAAKGKIIAALCACCIVFTSMIIPAKAITANPLKRKSASLLLTDTPNRLENFADSEFKTNMEKYHIPGGVISIVKSGKVVLSKGYGYANMEKGTKVDPEKTQFRIGSLTKLFTATSIMQLVEDGKVDLHANVNTYLKDFKIKDHYKTPVTMAELLTHTAGIDDDSIGDLSKTNKGIIPISSFLKKRMLPVIREPGTYI